MSANPDRPAETQGESCQVGEMTFKYNSTRSCDILVRTCLFLRVLQNVNVKNVRFIGYQALTLPRKRKLYSKRPVKSNT